MKEGITEISFANLEKMNKTLFIKLFKKPAPWKKTTAVICIAKHTFSAGKMKLDLVAIPFRKKTEALTCFKKEVKKAPDFKSKLTSVAALSYEKDSTGNLTCQITPIQGGLNLDYLDACGKELFSKLKIGFKVINSDQVMDKKDIKDVLSATDKIVSDKKLDKLLAKQAKRKAQLSKI